MKEIQRRWNRNTDTKPRVKTPKVSAVRLEFCNKLSFLYEIVNRHEKDGIRSFHFRIFFLFSSLENY